MNLLPNETILRESSSKALALTTHRIRYGTQAMGSATVKSIMLEELASCSIVKTSQPIFLILAVICAVIGLFLTATQGSLAPFIGGIIIGGIFALIYFTSQQQVIAFASAGATIRINTSGMKLETAKEFIDAAEQAKNARYLLLAR